jgi:hypothetical protein
MRRRGALLLEVSIAAGLVAVAMVAVAQLMAVAAQQERAWEYRRMAAQEAANALEQVMSLPWDQVTENRVGELALSPDAARRLPVGRLACQLEIDAGDLSSKRIVAEVSWKNRAEDRERVLLTAWRFAMEKRP